MPFTDQNSNQTATVAAKKMVMFPFGPVQTEAKWPFHAQKWKRDGEKDRNGQATERAVDYSNRS